MKKIFWGDTKDANLGLLLMRLFTGGAMLTHGVPKLFFTLDKFTEIVASLNLPMPGFLAFMAALSESLGAALLLLGLCTRPAAALLAITMAVAAFVVHGADPFAQQELALFYLCSSLLFMFKGAGKWSTDALIRR